MVVGEESEEALGAGGRRERTEIGRRFKVGESCEWSSNPLFLPSPLRLIGTLLGLFLMIEFT